MSEQTQPHLWTPDVPIDPCFRIPFRLLLSQNALVGEQYEKTRQIELWRTRGAERFIKIAREMKLPVEGYVEEKHYTYRGKPKKKVMAGERLKTVMFNEPIIIICRMWASDHTPCDIDNIHLKAVIDGFADARLVPNDTVNYIRGVFRWFEGVDPSVALSADEADERRRIRNQWKLAGLKKTLPPPPNKRFYLDIYRISRILSEKIDFFSLISSFHG